MHNKENSTMTQMGRRSMPFMTLLKKRVLLLAAVAMVAVMMQGRSYADALSQPWNNNNSNNVFQSSTSTSSGSSAVASNSNSNNDYFEAWNTGGASEQQANQFKNSFDSATSNTPASSFPSFAVDSSGDNNDSTVKQGYTFTNWNNNPSNSNHHNSNSNQYFGQQSSTTATTSTNPFQTASMTPASTTSSSSSSFGLAADPSDADAQDDTSPSDSKDGYTLTSWNSAAAPGMANGFNNNRLSPQNFYDNNRGSNSFGRNFFNNGRQNNNFQQNLQQQNQLIRQQQNRYYNNNMGMKFPLVRRIMDGFTSSTIVGRAIAASTNLIKSVDRDIFDRYKPLNLMDMMTTRKGFNDAMRRQVPDDVDLDAILRQAFDCLKADQYVMENLLGLQRTQPPQQYKTGSSHYHITRTKRFNPSTPIGLASRDGTAIFSLNSNVEMYVDDNTVNAGVGNGRIAPRMIKDITMRMGVRLNYYPWCLWLMVNNGELTRLVLVNSNNPSAGYSGEYNVPVIPNHVLKTQYSRRNSFGRSNQYRSYGNNNAGGSRQFNQYNNNYNNQYNNNRYNNNQYSNNVYQAPQLPQSQQTYNSNNIGSGGRLNQNTSSRRQLQGQSMARNLPDTTYNFLPDADGPSRY